MIAEHLLDKITVSVVTYTLGFVAVNETVASPSTFVCYQFAPTCAFTAINMELTPAMSFLEYVIGHYPLSDS